MSACPACGKDNYASALECKFCGVVFKKWVKHVKLKKEMGLSEGEGSSFEATSEPHNNKKKLIGLGIVLVLFFIIFMGYKGLMVSLAPGEIGFPIMEDGKWGFINVKGKVAIRPQFDAAERFSEGLAAVMDDKLWGYINEKGEWIVKPKYERAGAFSEGLALGRLISGYWEIIDKSGKSLGTTTLDPIGRKGGLDISTFHSGRAVVENLNQKKLFINSSGNGVGGIFEEAKDFSDGVAMVRQLGLETWRFIRPDGMPAFPFTFSRGDSFSDGIAPAEKIESRSDPGIGYIGMDGDYVLRPLFSEARSFHFGLAWAKTKDGLCGAIDRVGRIVFQVDCLEATGDFKERVAWTLKKPDNKYGVLDLSGTLVFRPAFSTPPEFTGGLAFVSIYNPKSGTAGYIDMAGNYVWKISFKDIKDLLGEEQDFDRKLRSCHVGEQLILGTTQ